MARPAESAREPSSSEPSSSEPPSSEPTGSGRRRPRGAVRTGLIAAGVELARTGGPEAVVLREATRLVGVVPNAAYRHFADRDVCAASMAELGDRMARAVAAVPGERDDPDAAFLRLGAIGTAYLEFARREPGLFATAFAVPQQHSYISPTEPGTSPAVDRSPLGQVRAALDDLVAAGVLAAADRPDVEYPIWSGVHGLAVLTGQGPLRDVDDTERGRLEDLLLGFIAKGLE
ncbi:MAG: TetR/AcrR family transcriptional regulator [Catenulispora sp.]|nr:TetR/AcrR family transcriptional regulator [Catenulispora sp.]